MTIVEGVVGQFPIRASQELRPQPFLNGDSEGIFRPIRFHHYGGEAMRLKLKLVLITAALSVYAGGNAGTYAAPPSDACSLVTAAQVSAALGVTVGDGKGSVPHECEWSQPGAGVGGKGVLVEILGPMGSKTPVDRFNTAKMPVPRIVKTPVSGLGDDAVFVETSGAALYVKKGDFVFQVRVHGFPLEEIKAKEKTLAVEVMAKL